MKESIKIDLEEASSYYNGFYIEKAVGNNAFSFEKRGNKRIYVPPLIEERIAELSLGNKTVFSEIEDGVEKNRAGLKNFIYNYDLDKHIFIFDNHNHAFFFWMLGYVNNFLEKDSFLVHIDQHSDMRKPIKWFTGGSGGGLFLKSAFEYTNYVLNVGNFIKPALEMGIFSRVEIVDSSYAFEFPIPEKFILDIDMDIFSDDMSYISEDIKFKKIKRYIERSDFITIATSPYFIEQRKAVDLVKKLFQ
jgi:hypothetical protein